MLTLLRFFWIFVLIGGCASAGPATRISDLQTRASQGDPESQFQLAVAYDQGLGTPQNLGEAVKWYTSAAELGHPEAQNSIGSLYQAGEGLPQSDEQAVVWYRKSADQGNATAKNNLAYMYDLGLGVAEDNSYAAQLYEEAAELGELKGMLNLGVLLFQGQNGVTKDYIEAYKWLDLARFYTQRSSDMNLKWRVRGALDELSTMMTAAEIEEAKGRVRAWDQAQKSTRDSK